MVDTFNNLPTVYSNFVDVLNSDKFKSIRKNYEEKFSNYKYEVHLKNDKCVKELHENGSNLLMKKEYKNAIKVFNEALQNAIHPSEATNEEDKKLFSKLIFGRSSSFYYCEYYDEFLEDANTLNKYFKQFLSSKQKEKLKKRIQISRTKLNEELVNLESEEKINFKNMHQNYIESKVVYGMDERISLEYNQKTKRGLIANKRIGENELISIQKPFISVLSPHLYTKHCYFCLIKLSKFGGFFPCRKCIQIKFCSSNCEEICWNEYHSQECTYLDLLNYSNSYYLQPKLALELVFKQKIENVLSSFHFKNQSNKKKIKNIRKQPLKDEIDYSYLNYNAINSLQDHANKCPDFSSPVILMLLFLLQKFKNLTNVQMIKLGLVLLKHLQQIHTNSKYILSKELKPEINNKHVDLLLLNDIKIGCSLFQTFSLINHDCEPNIISFYFIGDILHLKTLREILPGEQVCISYGCNWKWNTYDERQEFLSKYYFFNCQCKSCKTKLNPICHALKCSECENGSVFPFKTENKKYDSKCSKCNHKYSNLIEQTKIRIQGSVDLLEKINLLFNKGNESDFSKVKLILLDIQNKFNQVLHSKNRNLQLVKQKLSICCKLLEQHEESVQYIEQCLEIINSELNEHYSANFNTLIKLIDRTIVLFRLNSGEAKNLDHLKLDYLKMIKKAKHWININLSPTSDEYIYFLSFLSLSFSTYKDIK